MTNCQVWTDHKKGEEGVCLGYLLGSFCDENTDLVRTSGRHGDDKWS